LQSYAPIKQNESPFDAIAARILAVECEKKRHALQEEERIAVDRNQPQIQSPLFRLPLKCAQRIDRRCLRLGQFVKDDALEVRWIGLWPDHASPKGGSQQRAAQARAIAPELQTTRPDEALV